MQPTRATLAQLADLIRAVERHQTSPHGPAPALATGWDAIDRVLPGGGLLRGAVHEWCGVSVAESQDVRDTTPPPPGAPGAGVKPPAVMRRASRRDWTPPLCILTHLAWRSLGSEIETKQAEAASRKRKRKSDAASSFAGLRVLWIGRRCWPYGRGLVRGAPTWDVRLLRRSIFVDPPDLAARVWAIELALRSEAVAMVIADGSGLDIAATRRLQLAAEAGLGAEAGAIALLARPPDEERELSVAATRWRVGIAPQSTHLAPRDGALSRSEMGTRAAPRWAVALLRCKGAAASVSRDQSQWLLEWRHEKGVVFIPADVGDRLGAAKADAGAARLRIA